ncbi:MAG: hypothetical protein DMG09_22490 [Acidobacteria bacterium]|nr:MAG: hypothetical protein DMG09_22490 [Acidobacteriota bacterium]
MQAMTRALSLTLVIMLLLLGPKLLRMSHRLGWGTRGRKVWVAGRIDADDRFRTEDWMSDPAGPDDSDRGKRYAAAVFIALVVVALALALTIAGRR